MKLFKILLVAGAAFLIENTCFSQTVTIASDTAGISLNEKQKQNQTKETVKGKSQQGNSQNANGNQGVKQVKSARPDMTKVKGARPPNIVRPSGSGIPKGVGRPGGAIKPGKR